MTRVLSYGTMSLYLNGRACGLSWMSHCIHGGYLPVLAGVRLQRGSLSGEGIQRSLCASLAELCELAGIMREDRPPCVFAAREGGLDSSQDGVGEGQEGRETRHGATKWRWTVEQGEGEVKRKDEDGYLEIIESETFKAVRRRRRAVFLSLHDLQLSTHNDTPDTKLNTYNHTSICHTSRLICSEKNAQSRPDSPRYALSLLSAIPAYADFTSSFCCSSCAWVILPALGSRLRRWTWTRNRTCTSVRVCWKLVSVQPAPLPDPRIRPARSDRIQAPPARISYD